MEGEVQNLTFPQWSKALFKPKRYKIAFGGRGSGKSFTYTDALLITALQKPIRVLCAREYQISISESVHRLLQKRIEDLGLSAYFTIQRDSITSKTGSEFIFKGLRHNVDNIKSMAGINICWIEEAQSISQESLDILIPTIREPDSEIWMTMNPRLESDPVYRMFIANEHPDAVLFKVNYTENKHFPAVLDAERRLMLERDPALYNHVWLGECLTHTDAQIFKDKWEVREFTPENWGYPYYGLDFGFSQDPTACVKVWVHDETLYIEKEAVKIGLELDDTTDYIKGFMPEIHDAVIRADSARPESISYLKRHGLPRIKECKKWTDFKKEAILHMRAYKSIVVHPRCKETINEMMLYSYKVDHRSGDITTDILEKYDHCQDAIRYAIEPLLKRLYTVFDAFGG